MEKEKFGIFGIKNFSDIRTKRILEKTLLICLLSVLIGYLISPPIIFKPREYEEGDIILQTININEDLLIPDKVSTRLKKEKLLKEQRRIFDYDPKLLERTRKNVRLAFQNIRDQSKRLDKQVEEISKRSRAFGLDYFKVVSTLREVDEQISFYLTYKKVQKNRLEQLQAEGKLTAKGFTRKSKIDEDINTVNQILKDLREKRKYYQLEKESFGDRFEEFKNEMKTLELAIEEKRKEATLQFYKDLAIELNDSERKLFDFPFYTKEIETQLLIMLSEILPRKIVVSKELIGEDKEHVEIRNLVTGETSIIENDEKLLDLTEARTLVSDIAKDYFQNDESGKKKNLLITLGQKLVKPTVSENKLEYEKRKEELVANMSPVYFSVKKGEVIARAGDRASKQQVELINSYYEAVSNMDKIPGMIGIILIVLVSLILISVTFRLPGQSFRLDFKDQILIMTAVLVTLLMIKGGALLGELFETRYLNFQGSTYTYMLPVALGAMLVGILLNFEAALMTGLLTALFASIMVQSNLYYFFYAIMGCIVAALPMTKFDSRYSILFHGLKISAVNLPMAIIIFLIESNQIGVFTWYSVIAALAGGIITAVLTSFILPIFESLFDITTNLKLLELSNMNHPALKELIFKAPGTYQHSIIVGNLAESGASKVGANPLLSRVASYYHDIGKAVDSHFFIENQSPQYPNIHDTMDPYDSKNVIINHLERGAEISEKYRLGKTITNILLQHHGTNLVRYFYNKAKDQCDETNNPGAVNEDDFRYPGPKPQCVEAALVMLADISEAAVRSLDSPTPQLIRELTEKVCWNVLEDGQLDESGVTLKTFHTVVEVYTNMLISIHHQRIKYPEEVVQGKME